MPTHAQKLGALQTIEKGQNCYACATQFFQLIIAALFYAALFGNKESDNKRLGL